MIFAFGLIIEIEEKRMKIIENCLQNFNESLALYIDLCMLEECQEIYYLMSMIFYLIESKEKTSIAAKFYQYVEEIISQFQANTNFSRFNLNDSMHIQLLKAIKNNLAKKLVLIL